MLRFNDSVVIAGQKKFIAHEEKQEWEKLMSHNKMNKCALAVKLGLMVGTVALTAPVFAQQAQADGAKKDQQVEVIQVRGIRASQEALASRFFTGFQFTGESVLSHFVSSFQ